MITIKNFAKLCQCETSALRYYDKIGLLRPVSVDEKTGYRYYAESQMLDYIKIKNLQQAKFSIEEIKKLLKKSDEEIAEAFDIKIDEQKRKLAEMIEIQKSYLKEKESMEKMMEILSTYVFSELRDPKMPEEFNMNPDDHDQLVELIKNYMIKQMSMTPQNNENQSDDEESEEYTVIFQKDGWEHIYEFIDSIEDMEKGGTYRFDISFYDENRISNCAFALYMLGAMIVKKNGNDVKMGCNVTVSSDGVNHFIMRKEK